MSNLSIETPTNGLPEINKWYHCSIYGYEVYLVSYHQDLCVVYFEGEERYDGVPPNSLTPFKTDKDKFIEQVNEKLNLEDVMFKDVVEFIWDNGYGKLPD